MSDERFKKEKPPKVYKTRAVKRALPDPEPKAPEHQLDYEDQLNELMDEVAMFKALRPEIQRALKDKNVKKVLKEASAWATAQMVALAHNAQSEAVKQAALKDILDRAGWKPAERNINLSVNDMTDEEIEANLLSLLQQVKLKAPPEGQA